MTALRRIRIERDLTPIELGKKAGVSPEQISNLETGRAKNPRLSTIRKLAEALQVRPSALDPIVNPDGVFTPDDDLRSREGAA